MSSALVLAAIHESPPPDRFDAVALIALCHELGAQFGYDRVRLDRGVRPDGFWYEVGYAGSQVLVRFSDGRKWEVSRENYRPDKVTNLAYALEAGAVETPITRPFRICVDASCSRCGWAERWFDPESGVFGCNQCSYVSKERDR